MTMNRIRLASGHTNSAILWGFFIACDAHRPLGWQMEEAVVLSLARAMVTKGLDSLSSANRGWR